MRNILFLILLVAGLLLAFYFYREQTTAKAELQRAKTMLTETENKLLRQSRERDSLQVTQPHNTAIATDAQASAMAKLTKKGFTDPERQLLQSLQNQTSLLPQTGVLGGKMAYQKLTILTHKFALGYYEDGHVGGYSILRYTANSPRDIQWKLVDHHEL